MEDNNVIDDRGSEPLQTRLQRHPALDAWEHDWRGRAANPQAAMVRAVMVDGSPMTAYNLPNLDNMLARAVVDIATGGEGIPPSSQPYSLPVPLIRLWQSAAGLPLHAASCLFPEAPSPAYVVSDIQYLHRRMPPGQWSRGRLAARRKPAQARDHGPTAAAEQAEPAHLTGGVGRWMEKRTPVPVTVCRVWQGLAFGDIEEISRLLYHFSAIGKHRSRGFGMVERWEFVPITSKPGACLLKQSRGGAATLTRPVPVEYAEYAGLRFSEPPQLLGWAMPQWKPSLFSSGYPAGAVVATTQNA